MDIKQLERIDLNLLVALQALLEERSVSRAAERLFLSQSAMSKTLGRLRELFADRLFTRSANGMVPTPRARELAEQLPQMLQGLQALVSGREFEPLTYSGEFHVVIPEFVGFWALPELMSRLADSAPGIHLKTLSRAGQQLQLLADGELDMAIQVERQGYPPEYRVMTIGFAPPVLLARKGHPLEGRELTWEMIEQYPQVQVYIPDLEDARFVDQSSSAFIRHQSNIEPHMETGHLFTALQVIKSTDYLLPGPPIFIEETDLSHNVVALPLPGGEEVMLKYMLVWHERTDDSPPHQFLRRCFTDTVEHYRARRGMPSLARMREIRHLEV